MSSNFRRLVCTTKTTLARKTLYYKPIQIFMEPSGNWVVWAIVQRRPANPLPCQDPGSGIPTVTPECPFPGWVLLDSFILRVHANTDFDIFPRRQSYKYIPMGRHSQHQTEKKKKLYNGLIRVSLCRPGSSQSRTVGFSSQPQSHTSLIPSAQHGRQQNEPSQQC